MNARNNKGFTLMETMMVLGLSSLILIMVSSLFMTYFQVYKTIEDTVELEEQGQFSLEYMSRKLTKLNNIKTIKDRVDGTRNHINKSMPVDIWSIEFEELNIYGSYNTNVFQLRDNHKLFEGPAEVGNYITSILIEPIPEGYTYAQAKGLKIHMILERGNTRKTFEQSLSFRNKR